MGIGDWEELQAEGRRQIAEGGEKEVNGGVGEDFFGVSKGSEEWDDSPKTDDFGHSSYQH